MGLRSLGIQDLASALRKHTARWEKEVASRKTVNRQQDPCQQGGVCPCHRSTEKEASDVSWEMARGSQGLKGHQEPQVSRGVPTREQGLSGGGG